MVGSLNGLHVVRETDGFASVVVLDPALYSITFGDANKSAIFTRTGEEMARLFESHYVKFRRRIVGEQVLAVIVTLTGEMTVELHRDAVSAVKAFEKHMADKQSA
ncbi:hypothetical protein HY732_02420 [Candidatus Uhrbacteria bacterium]|nr:hypothetical protein [Candidatus Uhrbacteria bacterium]